MNYYVEIVAFERDGKPEEVVNRMGPMSERNADLVESGASRNMNHEDYYSRTVKGE